MQQIDQLNYVADCLISGEEVLLSYSLKEKLFFHTIYTLHHSNVDNIFHKFEHAQKVWTILLILHTF